MIFDLQNKGMESLTQLYRIGCGPSSSHTMGPENAVKSFLTNNQDCDFFVATLYGSLAKTGKGHGTDVVIKKTFGEKPCQVIFDYENTNIPHPNTLDITGYKNKKPVNYSRFLSVGGGKIVEVGEKQQPDKIVYKLSCFKDIKDYCIKNGLRLWQYVDREEQTDINTYLLKIWQYMKRSIESGLLKEGVLPGGLNVKRKAGFLYNQNTEDESLEVSENRLICAYAFAVSEENASCETIVTAPTCGASGVVPAVLYYYQQKFGYSDQEIVNALKTGGLIGNVVKTNASISGAECGCQAEIGTACAMASAALAELKNLSLDKIEYASEIAIEHHLGLTCDPICGLVQIPCIERNAVAAVRAINAVMLSNFLCDTRKISFDKVVSCMKETGKDMSSRYKETAEGGLAKINLFES